MQVRFQVNEKKYTPTRATAGDAGFDLCARIADGAVTLYGGQTLVIPCGVRIAIPYGYEGQVRGRSGMWFKHNITIGQTGTIDAGFRGEVCVKLSNEGIEPLIIDDGDRVAQIVFKKLPAVEMVELTAEEFAQCESERGEGGFGHTGR